MKAQAEKERAEKGIDVDVPASFGQKPEDHATFKPITFKSKKRTLEEANKSAEPTSKNDETSKVNGPNGVLEEVNDDNKENKKRKLNE